MRYFASFMPINDQSLFNANINKLAFFFESKIKKNIKFTQKLSHKLIFTSIDKEIKLENFHLLAKSSLREIKTLKSSI